MGERFKVLRLTIICQELNCQSSGQRLISDNSEQLFRMRQIGSGLDGVHMHWDIFLSISPMLSYSISSLSSCLIEVRSKTKISRI